MKVLKKISYIILVIALLSSQVVIPDFVQETEAQSLNDMKAELAELEKKYADSIEKKEYTEEEIADAKEELAKLHKEKEKLEEEIANLNEEIQELGQEIILKNEDMKNIIRYYQLSATGEDAYLEYLFTSTDFTDFIYRMAIAEQLSDYNESLINEYNDLIDKNEKKKEELSKKIVELDKKTLEIEDKLLEKNAELDKALDVSMSVESELKNKRRTIESNEAFYKEHNCDPDMEYNACVEKSNTLPPGSGFYRPLKSGRVSSNYGDRGYYLNGKWREEFHTGIDLSASRGTKVYAAADGMVKHIIPRASCGGNMVFINHKVNGVYYTTGYFHLSTIKVKEGDVVTANTVIGTVGGTSKEYWDSCSTGAHLHFQIGKGTWGSTYSTYTGFNARSVNPRKLVNFPKLGKSFSNRTTKY